MHYIMLDGAIQVIGWGRMFKEQRECVMEPSKLPQAGSETFSRHYEFVVGHIYEHRL
jgi:hypothetical protein